MKHVAFFSLIFLALLFYLLALANAHTADSSGATVERIPTPHSNPHNEKIQVVIDTDLGSYMDDSWGIAYLAALKGIFNISYMITATNDVKRRAKVAAKQLDLMESDLPLLGLGIYTKPIHEMGYLNSWVQEYSLSDYNGKVKWLLGAQRSNP
eukprot:gb/GECG01009834.1/.p1 GENE.gb/GECG01009834.1/~~gb/GECG01009834.1/.p1  ORF type:complete len:153 (+),score=13.88 gb/GECG01009834.1/:1-459(+)